MRLYDSYEEVKYELTDKKSVDKIKTQVLKIHAIFKVLLYSIINKASYPDIFMTDKWLRNSRMEV